MSESVEWIRVSSSAWIFTRPDGSSHIGDWPSFPPELDQVRAVLGPSNESSTRALLNCAIAAAAKNDASKPEAKRLTLLQYVAGLAGDVQRMEPTPRLFLRAAERFAERDNAELVELATAKAREETGHDRLALKDLQALGLPSLAIVQAFPSAKARELVQYFEDCVESDQPVRCFGYAFCLEQLALLRGAENLRQVQELTGSNADVTRCWRVHSALGAEVDHVEELVSVTARLAPAERALVIQAVYDTAQTIFSEEVPEDEYSDRYIEEQLVRIAPNWVAQNRAA